MDSNKSINSFEIKKKFKSPDYSWDKFFSIIITQNKFLTYLMWLIF